MKVRKYFLILGLYIVVSAQFLHAQIHPATGDQLAFTFSIVARDTISGDLAVEHQDMETALQEYGAAEKMFPQNLEMKYWKAVALANNGRMDEALPIFEYVFDRDSNWKELTGRLPASGLLSVSDTDLQSILKL